MIKRNCILIGVLIMFASGCSLFNKEKQEDQNAIRVKEFEGMVLVAKVNLDNLDKWRNFGGKTPPYNETIEFIANAVYTSEYGTMLEQGETVKIGKATVLQNSDGKNSGTKLILESAPPKQGLFFYCYGIDGQQNRFWALDKKTVEDILCDSFDISY